MASRGAKAAACRSSCRIPSTVHSRSTACASCRCRCGTGACRSWDSVFGNFAYLTDCNRLDAAAWPLLAGVETLILDALRHRPHTTHFTVDEAVAVAARIGARRTYFTHMCHDLGYAETNPRLPPGMELAYDGLVLDIEVEAAS